MKTLAIIVNYRAAALTVKAVQSVLESDSLGPVQVAVVDNSEDAGEAEQLRCALPSTVELRVSPENIGFGRACNLAFHQFPAESILLLNPDARLLPGSLLQLQQTLRRDARVGAVAPRVFWDEAREFLLPPSYLPGLMLLEEVAGISSRSQAAIMSVASSLWRRYAIQFWRSRRCVRVGNLSGGVVLLNTRAVQRAGGLYDPAFFLYFEDMDDPCQCGSVGCIESIASGTGMVRRARERLAAGEKSQVMEIASGNLDDINVEAIAHAAEQGDTLANAVLDDSFCALGMAVVSFLHSYYPSIVVIGGGVSNLGERMFKPVRDTVSRHAMDPAYVCPIVPAQLSGDVGLLGGLALALDPPPQSKG